MRLVKSLPFPKSDLTDADDCGNELTRSRRLSANKQWKNRDADWRTDELQWQDRQLLSSVGPILVEGEVSWQSCQENRAQAVELVRNL